MIPRKVLFGADERSEPKLSSDGRLLAFIGPHDGAPNVFVGTTEFRPITSASGRGIGGFHWAPDSRHVIYAQDRAGDENWRLFLTDVEPTAEVDDVGGQVPVDRCPRAVIDGLDTHLAGALPQDARDDGAVSLELVAHRVTPLVWVSSSPPGARSGPVAVRDRGNEKPPGGRRASGADGLGPAGPPRLRDKYEDAASEHSLRRHGQDSLGPKGPGVNRPSARAARQE